MPTISRFFGIVISMFWQDNMPPHFHASYGEDEALIDIERAVVLRGRLPSSRLKLVLAWAEIHRDELLENWHRAQGNQDLAPIEPLLEEYRPEVNVYATPCGASVWHEKR